eukprot:323877_1
MSSIVIPETPSPILNTSRSRLRRNRANEMNESSVASLSDSVAEMSPLSSNISQINISSNISQINNNAYINYNPISTTRFRKWIGVESDLSLQEINTNLLENNNIISWISLKQTDQNSTMGYIHLAQPQTYGSTILRLFNDRHMNIFSVLKSVIRSTYNAYDWGSEYFGEHNINYFEYNSREKLPFTVSQTHQEKVDDIVKFVNDSERFPNGPNFKQFIRCFPSYSCNGTLKECFAQQKKLLKDLLDGHDDQRLLQTTEQWYFQRQTLKYVKYLIDIEEQRQITILRGQPGGEGKSKTARLIEATYPGQVLVIPGYNDAKDLSHHLREHTSFNDEPKIVIIDEPMDKKGDTDYSVLEDLKNGRVFCAKYNSTVLRFRSDQIPIVLLLTNTKIKNNVWSITRFDPIDIIKTEAHPHGELQRMHMDFSNLEAYNPDIQLVYHPIP